MNKWARWLQSNGPGRFQLAYKGGWDAFVNAAPRRDLDVLTRAQMARLDEESLEDYNEARMVWNANLPTVKTHQLAAAFAVIDQVMASNRRDSDRLRGSVVVDASPGWARPRSRPDMPATSTAASCDATRTEPARGTNGYRSRSCHSQPA